MRIPIRGTCSGLASVVLFLGVLTVSSCALNPVSASILGPQITNGPG